MLMAIVLIVIVLFLALNAGYFLYNPGRFSLSSPFGVLEIIRGNIQVLKKDALSWQKASSGMILEPGSRVKTAADARAVITFASGTTTTIEPGTDLIIDRIEEGQGTQAYAVILKQQSGKTWNQVDKAVGSTNFQIRTASAEITVHGTLFTTEVDEAGKTIVQTTEGRVNVSAGGDEVEVPAGMMTQAKPGEKPSAPMALPQAKNELVITVNQPAYGLVKDPSGSSAGYLNSGAKVNQIYGSSISAIEPSGQTIRIREPEIGDYTLALRGIADGTGQVSVEGLVGGKRSFLHIESCNITAAKDTLLKLHYEVIDGLLQRTDASDQGIAAANHVASAAVIKESSKDAKETKTQPAPANTNKTTTAVAKQGTPPDKGFNWLGGDKNTQLGRLVSVACFVFLIGIIFIFMRRKG